MKQVLNQFRAQLGWQGVSGIALLALAGLLQVLALQPLESEVSFMRSHVAVGHTNNAMQSRNFNLTDQQNELGMLFDSLPVEREVTDILGAIYVAGETSGIKFDQAEYHPDRSHHPRVEYVMIFPVQGEYTKIRYFVTKVLADHPAIALDQVNFQRDKISDLILKAEIRFTLFLRQKE